MHVFELIRKNKNKCFSVAKIYIVGTLKQVMTLPTKNKSLQWIATLQIFHKLRLEINGKLKQLKHVKNYFTHKAPFYLNFLWKKNTRDFFFIVLCLTIYIYDLKSKIIFVLNNSVLSNYIKRQESHFKNIAHVMLRVLNWSLECWHWMY